MRKSNPNNEWVCLDVGGKVFKTTKSTLSARPESFLARLVNSNLPSDKDDTGAFLIDRDPEHFRTILNYLRCGDLNIEKNDMAMKELLSEADFYNIQPLVDEIRKAMKQDSEVVEEKKPVTTHTEMVIVSRNDQDTVLLRGRNYHYCGTIDMSETAPDYEVLQALRLKRYIFNMVTNWKTDTHYINTKCEHDGIWTEIESTLSEYGFVRKGSIYTDKRIKFYRTVRK